MSLDSRNPGPGSEPDDLAAPLSDPTLQAPADEVVLIVSGEVDLATRDELLVRLLTLVLTSGRRVVIDLSDGDFLDAAGAPSARATSSPAPWVSRSGSGRRSPACAGRWISPAPAPSSPSSSPSGPVSASPGC